METSNIAKNVERILSERPEVLFGYLHGSALSSDNPRDIDVAVFLDPERYENLVSEGELNLTFAIPLEMELEARIGYKVDVQVLNGAPLPFQYRVIETGVLIADKDSDTRCDFESLTRVKYFDFRPRLRAYLQEIIT